MIEADERIKDVRVTDDAVSFELMDGRSISVPIVWYPRLLKATPEQCANWVISAAGHGVHWPDIDEDLSSAGFLHSARRQILDRDTS